MVIGVAAFHKVSHAYVITNFNLVHIVIRVAAIVYKVSDVY